LDYKTVRIERLHYFTKDVGRSAELAGPSVKFFVIARRKPYGQEFSEWFE